MVFLDSRSFWHSNQCHHLCIVENLEKTLIKNNFKVNEKKTPLFQSHEGEF